MQSRSRWGILGGVLLVGLAGGWLVFMFTMPPPANQPGTPPLPYKQTIDQVTVTMSQPAYLRGEPITITVKNNRSTDVGLLHSFPFRFYRWTGRKWKRIDIGFIDHPGVIYISSGEQATWEFPFASDESDGEWFPFKPIPGWYRISQLTLSG